LSALAALAQRLGLSDDEVLSIFRLDPLEALGGEHHHRPEIELLDAMTADAAELAGAGALASWVRSSAERPPPLELLRRREFPAFEDALERWLRDSGLLN
jgi:hypothetical protein